MTLCLYTHATPGFARSQNVRPGLPGVEALFLPAGKRSRIRFAASVSPNVRQYVPALNLPCNPTADPCNLILAGWCRDRIAFGRRNGAESRPSPLLLPHFSAARQTANGPDRRLAVGCDPLLPAFPAHQAGDSLDSGTRGDSLDGVQRAGGQHTAAHVAQS